MAARQSDFPHFDLSVLSPREELIIQARYGLGWSLSRIAKAIGVTQPVISIQHSRALQALHSRGISIESDEMAG